MTGIPCSLPWGFKVAKRTDEWLLQFRKKEIRAEDDVPYGYGFFHFVFATGAMYFAMLLIGWNTHHAMKKYAPLLLLIPIFQ